MRRRSHLDVVYGDSAMGWLGLVGLVVVGLIVLLVRALDPSDIAPKAAPEPIAVSTTATTSSTTPTTVVVTTSSAQPTTTSAQTRQWTWDEIAACESNGRWHIHDSLHQGGLQFAVSTWDAYAPPGFPVDAHLATREQQILVAELVLEDQGPGAWPVCSRKVGMR